MPEADAPPHFPQIVNSRYRLEGPPIGQGGMGIVYRAYDTITKRDVALKTTWSHVDPSALELFEREWTVLARLSHPNIVDILDTGELEEGGQRKPYFAMPLLRGQTLDRLIRAPGESFSAERTVDIMTQVCRGLQAAHSRDLVHRDLKPSNIFVMDDDTVKIIDFGVVHLADTRSITGLKGTLQYMAPEQIELQPITPMCDIFSLGVVCYETLTGRKPFARATEADTAEAVRRYIPPPISDINNTVNRSLSRTVHKAMAKQPRHRFSSAREFGETMQKALRNDPIERFDRGKIQPRIERIKKAYSEGDLQFASEILSELESEGDMDTEMPGLRNQIDRALREKNARQLLDGARMRMQEQEYVLASERLQDVLHLDPENAEALALRTEIERRQAKAATPRRKSTSSEEAKRRWIEEVDRHFTEREYDRAQGAIAAALKEFPDDPELSGLASLAAHAIRRSAEANRLLKGADTDLASGRFEVGIEALRNASRLDDHNPEIHAALIGALVDRARSLVGNDWRAADPLVKEALALDRNNAVARSLTSLIEEYRRSTPSQGASSHQAAGKLAPAPPEPVFRPYLQPKSKIPVVSIAAAVIAIGAAVAFGFRWIPLLAPVLPAARSSVAPVRPPSRVSPQMPAQKTERTNSSAAAPNIADHKPAPDHNPATTTREQVRPAAKQSSQTAPPARETAASPPSDFADIDLLTLPPGARMIVDGSPETTCTSPCTLSLAGGRHVLVTRMDGYEAARRVFSLPETRSLIVSLAKSGDLK